MKEKILELHKQGKTYREIATILGCVKSNVAFHCSKQVRRKQYIRQNQTRQLEKKTLVNRMGGACIKCGYNKCLSALEFHHLEPTEKEFSISQVRNLSEARIEKELKKCILVCANCHREIHENDAKDRIELPTSTL